MECSTALEPWEGQAGAREYRFAAREVGEALVSAARGGSYQAAAEAARRAAGRLSDQATGREWRRRDPARDGQIVANWVDVFTEVVCAGELPDRWPHTLLIDSKNYRIRTGGRAGRGFHVFAAMGWDPGEPGTSPPVPKAWRLEPFPRKDQAAWEAFFGALEGSPRVVVSDADNAIAAAIATVFADAHVEHRLCDWHLGRKLREHLPDEILADHKHPISHALTDAFHSPQGWQALVQAVEEGHTADEHRPLTLALAWIQTYGPRVNKQTATRDPAAPHSTGPVEKLIEVELDRRIGDRVGSFTNRARLAKLLKLITLEIRDKGNGPQWADRLRERLYHAGGRPTNQRPHDDPKGVYSLIS